MANLREWLESAVAELGEPIEAMVVGQHYRMKYDSPAAADENVVLSAADGLAKIDVEYDAGYGGADCFPFYAWTKSRVYFVGEYDGATGLNWVPRHPVDMEPNFSGE
jgi:hypothetical protein